MKKLLFVFGLIFIVGFAIIGGLSDRPSETSPPVVIEKPSHPAPYSVSQKVFISGVEDGELVVPKPTLWQKPGGLAIQGQGVRTMVKSGTPVKITDSRYASGRWFFHVETYGANKGKNGWISETLLKP